jgi:hypothetical protein
VKFGWTLECEEFFQQLRDILTSALILNIEYPEEDLVFCTNACKEGISGVLTQKDHVVFYGSRKLKEHGRNYATHDLELAAIIHLLKMWRHYLMGRNIELRIDHYGLKKLFGMATLNAIQIRLLELLSEYDFKIKHIKGKENQVADALSKRVYEMHIATISM